VDTGQDGVEAPHQQAIEHLLEFRMVLGRRERELPRPHLQVHVRGRDRCRQVGGAQGSVCSPQADNVLRPDEPEESLLA